VIVWLGDGREDGDQALERIHSAAGEGTNSIAGSTKRHQVASLKLLQREWFRRVWVRFLYVLIYYTNYSV
jgi:hypothetical protein